MGTGHRWRQCGDDLLQYLAPSYEENGNIHWPTLIAATAGMGGEMALLAKERDLPERGYVVGKNVTPFLCDDVKSPKSLWGYCLFIATQAFKLDASLLPDFHTTETRITASLAGNPDFVPLSVSAHLAPRHNVLNAGPRHRRKVYEIAHQNGLDNSDAAFALMTATMKVIGHTRRIGPEGMLTLAMEAMIGCARVVPLTKPLSNPSFGKLEDIVPQGADAPRQVPLLEPKADIWGDKRPELEPMPASFSNESEQRRKNRQRTGNGFGRRN